MRWANAAVRKGVARRRPVCITVAPQMVAIVVMGLPTSAPAGEAATTMPESHPHARQSYNSLSRNPYTIHGLIIDETPEVFATGRMSPPVQGKHGVYQSTYTSRVIRADFPFNELVPSWNITVPAGAGFLVRIRLGVAGDERWTADYHLDRWGRVGIDAADEVTRDEYGRIDVDHFRSPRTFDRIQYRVVGFAPTPDRLPGVERFALAYTNALGDDVLARTHCPPSPALSKGRWARRLDVPFLTQRGQAARYAGRSCSPTCVAMVLGYYGVEVTPEKVGDLVYDPAHALFGNWPRAVQGAFMFGVGGHLERFSDWHAVRACIARGRPIIASIRFYPPQRITGAPYSETDGHLLVVTGFDGSGNVCVNDPAHPSAATGRARYPRTDLEQAWLDHGGLGYVLYRDTSPANGPTSQPAEVVRNLSAGESEKNTTSR